jgi:multisubunit Na+/H+ antiporter MnhB subunit
VLLFLICFFGLCFLGAVFFVIMGRDGMGMVAGSVAGIAMLLVCLAVWHWSEIASWILAAIVGWIVGRSTYSLLSTKEQRAKMLQKSGVTTRR